MMKKLIFAAVLLIGLGCACQKQGGCPLTGEESVKEVTQFLDSYYQDLAGLEKATFESYWKASNTGAKADFDVYAANNLKLVTLHSDPERYKKILSLQEKYKTLTVLEKRSLQVAELAFKENQLPKDLLEKLVNKSAEIEMLFNTYRVELDGKRWSNNDLLEALAKEKDMARRQAYWQALKEVGGQVAPKLLELAALRNQAAKTLGYENFWDMRVRLQEYDPAVLVRLFDELDQATREPFARMKKALDGELGRKFGAAPEALMPWAYDDPFFQAAPPSEALDPDVFYKGFTKEFIVELGGRFYKDIGLGVDDLIARSDFYEREGKDQHAFCISIDRKDDVRMLLNVKPTASWMDTMLHETGHAAYYKYLSKDLPYNLRESAHIFTTEGVAMMFGALARNPEWLLAYAGVPEAEVKPSAAALAQQRWREQLIFARWTLVMFNFERALYQDPTQDLNKVWYDLVERFQSLTRPLDRNLPDWAAKPHFTIAPVYYHNYMLGEVFGARLRATLAKLISFEGPTSALPFSGHKEFGTFLKDKIFAPGMSLPWNEFVKSATGRELDLKDYAKEINSL